MDSVRRPVILSVLLLAAAIAPATGETPTVIRVSDAVGDTIDRAERDSFRLFPGIREFRQATIVETPRLDILADLAVTDGDSLRHVFFRLAPSQLERIRFLVDNVAYVKTQVETDTSAAMTLAAFWHAVQEGPLGDMEGDPAAPPNLAQLPPEPSGTEESRPSPSHENAYNYGLAGATLGSMVGGCIGSHAGITYARTEEASCLFPAHDVYTLDPCVFWGWSCGITALGTGVGCALGAKEDRSRPVDFAQLKEGTSWRAGMAIGGLVAGATLGLGTFWVTSVTRYGVLDDMFDTIENDEDGWTVLPMAFTGLCIAVEGATIGWRIGRAIDRRKAEEAEAHRRMLGRE